MSAIQVLLRNSIDYAGLFPPAGLDMKPAVDNYARYLAGSGSWALGRLVVPAGRLADFEQAAERHLLDRPEGPRWQLSALLAADLESDLAAIDDFNRRRGTAPGATVQVDAVEVKASSIAAAEDTMHRVPDYLQAYIEIPLDGEPDDLIAAIARSGRGAKMRTGGVTPEAFPNSADVVGFMAACVRHRAVFKATAGLHHPLRAEYRLTYESDSPRGLMFGFLNVFLAAAFLGAGLDHGQAQQILEERRLSAFQVEYDGICWGSHRLSLADLQRARRESIVSFGSCSFTEPLEELQALHLLDARVAQA
jgi:hypothetical protein